MERLLRALFKKKIYSVDASIYEIEPSVVVLPRTQEALIEAVRIAHHHSVPVTPRGLPRASLEAALVQALLLIQQNIYTPLRILILKIKLCGVSQVWYRTN